MATNSYNVGYTDPSAGALQVADDSLNTETDLTFVGRNKPRYAQHIAENFLHLLENFANLIPPPKPTVGQLWFNTNPEVMSLNIYNGDSWVAAGSVTKSTDAPGIGQSGDLWVDPTSKQLFIFSGTTWDLVGPQFSSGLVTGPKVETMIDSDNITHSISSIYANNDRIAIISDSQFLPKSYSAGFATINRGINLSTNANSSNSAAVNKLWGTAFAADNLNYNGDVISATNFLRSDINSTTLGSINVKSNDGITVGQDPSFIIGAGLATVNLTSIADKNININFSTTAGSISGLYIKKVSSNSYIGIGNNTNPQTELDIIGSATISESLIITGTSDSTSLSTGSIVTNGGLAVTKKSNFGDTVAFNNTITLSKDNEGPVALPAETTTPIYDIGSETQKFRNVYALQFGDANAELTNRSNFYGVFNGDFTGDVNGAALSLQNAQDFQLSGDVTSDVIHFNGTRPATFNTTISPQFFTGKTVATTSLKDDQILTFRASTGIQRTSKSLFLASVPVVPVGTILPFAGSVQPIGYLFCDGSEVMIDTYKSLFDTIGYAYRSQGLLIGKRTFALPDLRGRFPLGKDNMDNDLTVTTAAGSEVNAGGNRNGIGSQSSDPANRVHEVASSTLGYGSGNDSIGPLAAIGATGKIATVTDVDVSLNQQASSIMNPYQTINYIIFTGNLS